MHPNVIRVADAARAAGLEIEVRRFPEGTRTAEAREATGFAIGGVPPFGHRAAPVLLLDRDLLGQDLVWAAAGLPDAVFPITPDDLLRASGARVADLGERPGR